MNKAVIGNVIVLLLLLALVMISLTIYIGDITTTYSVNNTGLQNATYLETARDVSNMSESMKQNIENAKITNIDILDAPLMVMSGGIEAVKILFKTMDLTVNIITDIAGITGLVPGWAVSIVLSIVMITITLALLGALLKYELVTL